MTEEIEIRDRRNGQWAWINIAVIVDPHLTPTEKLFYAALATFAGYQEIKPSVPTIAERCSLSIRTVRMTIKRLRILATSWWNAAMAAVQTFTPY